jgi:hypothetical protein
MAAGSKNYFLAICTYSIVDVVCKKYTDEANVSINIAQFFSFLPIFKML